MMIGFFFQRQTPKISPESTRYRSDFDAVNQNCIKGYVELDTFVVFCDIDKNLEVLSSFKDLGYQILVEMSGIDFIQKQGGIEVFYLLLNINDAKRAMVKTFVESTQMLRSSTKLFKSANWAERELYDMFGVLIDGHPNLKRILMPDDWNTHPLLKSYPLQGDEFSAWYEVDKIFGKENRDKIGPENRDPAFIDDKDTFNFGRIYHETKWGQEPASKPYKQEYQEEGGVKFVKKIKRDGSKILKKRP